MSHAAFAPGHTAVIMGGASGIGLAAAHRFLALGLNVALVDRQMDPLAQALEQLEAEATSGQTVIAAACDVTDRAGLARTAAHVGRTLGAVHVLMNNAGIQPGSAIFGPEEGWDAVLSVNLGGVINGTRAFGPAMLEHGAPGLIINTGSKQGITTPPGDPAYNVSKAGVKAYTEALAHELRERPDCRVGAALLIPGFVFTGLTARGRTEKPDGAWTAGETVDFMMDRLAAGDFYILCPDNEVTRPTDEKRILWAAQDLIDNRPPLSRWHPDWSERFAHFMKS